MCFWRPIATLTDEEKAVFFLPKAALCLKGP